MSRISIALNRFGLGARLEDQPPADPDRWLLSQFDRYEPRPEPIRAVPGERQVAAELTDYVSALRQARMREQRRADQMDDEADPMGETEMQSASGAPDARQRLREAHRDLYLQMVGARTNAALTTPAPFIERLVHFWANHFAVSAEKISMIGLAGLFEFDAIRPYVLGRFEDMLLAVEQHPAMLIYLDQVQSIGPNSPIGSRMQRPDRPLRGLNENLAREILELHTLGVGGGYNQADVTEFSRALTGWTVQGLGRRQSTPDSRGDNGGPGRFRFAEGWHEPGARQLLGRSYAQGGEAQGRAILSDLARQPSTAQHLATKLARHFAGDEPPPALVERLADAYQQSDGDLPTVYRALLASSEAWVDRPVKFKSPWDWHISALRAVGMREIEDRVAVVTLTQLGQPVWKPGSPAGYDDLSARWAGSDALVRRVELASRIARRAGDRIDPRALAPRLFPEQLSEATARSIASAESESQGLALLLVSPEFQWR